MPVILNLADNVKNLLHHFLCMLHILQVILFILPAYFANALPVLLGGGRPMDFNLNFIDGKRILGNSKTWQGFFAGFAIAWLLGCVYAFILPLTALSFYTNSLNYVILGSILGFGTMFGDAFGSFIKRRIGIDIGAPSFIIDQLPFLYVSLFLVWVCGLSILNVFDILWLTVLTYFIHRITNIIANKLHWKKVPW